MDREQYLAATTRNYPGKSKEQVIAAAQRILNLAEPWDMQIAHTDDGFNAFRLLDVWEFKVRETPEGPRGALQIRSSTSTTYLAPTTSVGTYSVASSSTPSVVVPGDAVYSLFWARMDYMMWKRDTWPTCAEANTNVSAGKISGPLGPLCDYALHDDVPGQMRKPRYRSAKAEEVSPTPPSVAPDRTKN
jgi:hypothetical protein